MSDVLYVGNDHVVELKGVKDANGDVVNDAVASATLYESDGTTEVGGAAWPITLANQGYGRYEGGIPASADLTDGGRYILKIDATSLGKTLHVERVMKAETREEFGTVRI